MSLAIPFHDSPHPVTRLSNSRFGMWLFLSSEVMLFASLISTYVLLRTGSQDWPEDALNLKMGSLNTLLMIASSLFITGAVRSLRKSNVGGFSRKMSLSLLLGVGFLVVKGFEYQEKFAHGLVPGTHTFYAIYYTMTGLHAAHLVAGIFFNAYLLIGARSAWKKSPAHFTEAVASAALYWNFIDVVWLVMFSMLYLT